MESLIDVINHPIYSYKEGLAVIMQIVIVALIVAVINMLVSLIIGIRKRDCLTILVANVMVKTVLISIISIIDILDNFFIIMLFFIATVVIEGLIYIKILKNKKYDGILVSVVCNIGAVGFIILMFLIFEVLRRLL